MTRLELDSWIRTLADDDENPPLIKTTFLDIVVPEAEREAAERALYLRTDSTYNISIVENTSKYSISQNIIGIERLKLDGQPKPLIKTTKRELDFDRKNWELLPSDIPVYYFQENYNITLFPKPNAAYTLLIDAFRRPTTAMTETPTKYHENLAYWCLYRHYSRPDADIMDRSKASDALQLFTKFFGHKKSAWYDYSKMNSSPDSPMYKHPFN